MSSSAILNLEKEIKILKRALRGMVKVEKAKRNNTKCIWVECWNCHQKFPQGLFTMTELNADKCPYCTAKEITKE